MFRRHNLWSRHEKRAGGNRDARTLARMFAHAQVGAVCVSKSMCQHPPHPFPHPSARHATHVRRLSARIKLRDAAVAALPEELQEEAKKIDNSAGEHKQHFVGGRRGGQTFSNSVCARAIVHMRVRSCVSYALLTLRLLACLFLALQLRVIGTFSPSILPSRATRGPIPRRRGRTGSCVCVEGKEVRGGPHGRVRGRGWGGDMRDALGPFQASCSDGQNSGLKLPEHEPRRRRATERGRNMPGGGGGGTRRGRTTRREAGGAGQEEQVPFFWG
jgi:hypothetical protein